MKNVDRTCSKERRRTLSKESIGDGDHQEGGSEEDSRKKRLSDSIRDDLRTVGKTIEDTQYRMKWKELVSAAALSHS